MRKNQAIVTDFSRFSAAFCLEPLYFVPCGQGSTWSYCCSAVSRSLIAWPPPFLGVSSLNLAALRSGHFFCADLLARGGVARRSWALSPHRSSRLATDQNLWRKKPHAHGRSVHFARVATLLLATLLSRFTRTFIPQLPTWNRDAPAGKAAWRPTFSGRGSSVPAPARSPSF